MDRRTFVTTGALATMGAAAPANAALAAMQAQASSKVGMVVAPQPESVNVGVETLKAGGNAVDAAIATAFHQGVIDPSNCGVAGFGSVCTYMKAKNTVEHIDFYPEAPAATRPDMWESILIGEARDGYGFILKGNVNESGYQSVCVPNNLRGYAMAHARHGRMPWKELIAPAIETARMGYVVHADLARNLSRPDLQKKFFLTADGRKIYGREDGSPKREGDLLINGDLANTLEAIAKGGPDVLYKGEMARHIAADFKAHGGLISEKDLAGAKASLQKSLMGTYRGRRIATSNPPYGGLQMLQVLNTLENFDLKALGHNSTEYTRVLSEAMKLATIDKDQFVGDPRFVKVPVERLGSKQYAAELAQKIKSGVMATVPRFNPGGVSSHTTTMAVIDSEGNCVSMTHTLGAASGVITPGLGFMYNNAMALFDPRPGRAGSMAPGKSRYSGICNSIVFNGDTPYIIIGALGGNQIPFGVMQAILNVLEFDMTMNDAIASPRFSALSDIIDMSRRAPNSVVKGLEAKGYKVNKSPNSYSFPAVWVHGIRMVDGQPDGGADPGMGGMALSTAI